MMVKATNGELIRACGPRGTNPSDAIVLFDGKNLDEWVSNRDKSPAKWPVADGVLTVRLPLLATAQPRKVEIHTDSKKEIAA